MPTGATLVRVVRLRRRLGLDAIAERHDMRAFGRITAPVFTTAALDVMAHIFIIGRQGFDGGVCVRTSSSNENMTWFCDVLCDIHRLQIEHIHTFVLYQARYGYLRLYFIF